MNKIYIIFSFEAEFFFSLAKQLFTLQDAFSSVGLQYQSIQNKLWQDNSLNFLSYHLAYRIQQTKLSDNEKILGATDKIIENQLKHLEESSRSQIDQIWLFGWTYTGCYGLLKKYMSHFPSLTNRTVQSILVVQKQDELLKQWTYRSWKQYKPSYLYEQMIDPGKFYNYDDAYSELENQFESVSVLIDHGDMANSGPQLWNDLGTILNIEMPGSFKAAPYPKTYPGLDIAKGVFDFPFTFLDKQVFDRNKFYELVEHIEGEEGFQRANINLANEAKMLQENFGPQNEKLAKRLGMDTLFAPGNSDSDGIPFEALPIITAAQCRPFVAAMREDLRVSLLRFFRDREVELCPEELVLAKSLEEYRKKFTHVSGFSFPREEPLLSVLTMTRNHKDYILDCMESVTAQKTDFTIEHIIVDDFSDDGTQDIIENYASQNAHVRPFFLPYRSYGGLNVKKLFNACKSKYAAICDGDDYFIQPYKLKKQVDYLEKNQDCALCFHPVLAKYENDTHPSFIFPPATLLPRGIQKKYYLADLFIRNIIQTNSVMYRWRFRDGLPEWFRSDICPSDWYWHLLHAEKGKIGFLPEIMSIYRRHGESWYSDSFISPLEHRRKHGMSELETYKAMNDHFKNRYFSRLSCLAGDVFACFLTIKDKEGDSSLMDAATDRYPEFALDFMKKLNKIRKENPKANLNDILNRQ